MDEDDIEARLEAVERALAEGGADGSGAGVAAEHERELDSLTDRVDALDSRLDDLEASVQAVRGYVGNVRSVNRDVERRADAALAKVEALEERVETGTAAHGVEDLGRTREPNRTGGGHDRRESSGRAGDETPHQAGGDPSPGDIARRITGDGEAGRGHESSRSTRGREGTAQPNRETRGRPRDAHAGPPGAVDEDADREGFLAGLRDAL